MNSYQKNTVTVLDYLSEAGVCQSVYDMSHSCFTKLGRHLSSRKIDFSLEEAEKWLDGLKLSDASIKMYSKAIRQLGDVYNFGHVCFLNRANLNLNHKTFMRTFRKEYTMNRRSVRKVRIT